MLKYLCIALLPFALCSAEYLYGDIPTYNTEYAAAYDNYKPRDYKFEYGVSDPHTGDHKSQWEVRENGVVRGAYSLLEADGTTRIVDYYADDTGFHADVKKIGTAVHAAPEHNIVNPIAKVHLADSIAYNGYGHGGLDHGYGAPIEAIQHVAAVPSVHHVEAAPLEHVAPIAYAKEVIPEVQHVQPVQQIIAPALPSVHVAQQPDYSHLITKYSQIQPAVHSFEHAAPSHYAHTQQYHYQPEIVNLSPNVHVSPVAQVGQISHVAPIQKAVPAPSYSPFLAQLSKIVPSLQYGTVKSAYPYEAIPYYQKPIEPAPIQYYQKSIESAAIPYYQKPIESAPVIKSVQPPVQPYYEQAIAPAPKIETYYEQPQVQKIVSYPAEIKVSAHPAPIESYPQYYEQIEKFAQPAPAPQIVHKIPQETIYYEQVRKVAPFDYPQYDEGVYKYVDEAPKQEIAYAPQPAYSGHGY